MPNMLSLDTICDFLIERVNELSDFDTSAYGHMKGAVLTEKVVNFPGISNPVDCQTIITRALADLTKMIETGNIPELINFYSAIKDSPIHENEIVITVPNMNEIDKIRPMSLSSYPETIQNSIVLFTRGSIDSDRLKLLSSDETTNNLKRQLCKSTINSTYDITDIAKSMNGTNVTVDSVYIFNQIIPFLKNLAVDYKDLSREAATTIDVVNSASKKMSDIITGYNAMNTDYSVDKKLSLFLYKSIRNFLTLRSYVSFLMTRKILIYMNTVLAFSNLYNVMLERYPEGARILHESVLDGNLGSDVEDIDLYNDMINGESNLMGTKIRSAIDMRSTDISNFSNKIIGYNILNVVDSTSDKYDLDAYQNIVDIFKSIDSRITDFVNSIMAGEIFDDAQAHTGFDQSISMKYSTLINKFNEVNPSDFNSNNELAIDQIVAAYSELLDMTKNIEVIQSAIKSSRNKIDDNTRTLNDAKINQHEIPVSTLNEATDFMTEIDRQFKDLVVQVYKAIYNRVLNLDEAIHTIMASKDSSDIVVSESYDDPYDADGIMNEMQVENALLEARNRFTECAMDYEKSRTYMYERVNVVFEADTVASDTSTASATPAPSNGSVPKHGISTDKIMNYKSLGDRLKDIGTAIKEFFKKLFGRVSVDAAKSVAKSESWFKMHEQELLNADVSNLSVRMLPYNDAIIDQANSDVNAIKGKIVGLKDGDIKGLVKNPQSIHAIIYKDIPLDKVDKKWKKKSKTEAGFKDFVRQYYSIGTAQHTDETPLTADQLKTRLPIMIAYCKGYKDTIEKFHATCTSVASAIDQKVASIVKESTSTVSYGVDFANFIFEADAAQDTKAPSSNPAPAPANNTQNNQNTNTQQSSDKSDNKPSVEVKNGNGGTSPVPANASGDTSSAKYTAANSISRDFMTFTSSVITAFRDRYIAYMDVMKKILKASGVDVAAEAKGEPQQADQSQNNNQNEAPAQNNNQNNG